MSTAEIAAAAARMQAAIFDQEGTLRPISRVEFEIMDSGAVRWNLWQGSKLLYSAPGKATDVHGFLCASKQIMEIRAEDLAAQRKGETANG